MRIKEDHQDIPIVIVGNKTDLESERQVSKEDGKALAQKFGAGFFECSVKANVNVTEVFYELVRMINNWRAKHPSETRKPGGRGGKGRGSSGAKPGKPSGSGGGCELI